MKVLIAADGSKFTRRAVDYLISHKEQFGASPNVVLLNVQYQIPPLVVRSLPRNLVADYYTDEGKKAVVQAKRVLDRAGIAFRESHMVGEPGTVIAEQATKGKFDMVVMGSHGYSSLSNLVLGSTTSKVLSMCKVPVLIIR